MKGTLPRTAVALAVITACLAGSALAQQPQPRQPQLRHGFWFSGGLGDGSLRCPNCSGRTGALSGNILLGGALGPQTPPGGFAPRRAQTGKGPGPPGGPPAR